MSNDADIGSDSAPRSMALGAGHGFVVWTVYAAAERVFAVFLPRLLHPATFVPTHPGFSVMLLLAYPVVGACLGAASALLLRHIAARPQASSADGGRSIRALSLFALIAAFCGNFFSNMPLGSPFVLLTGVLGLALTGSILLTIRSSRGAASLSAFVNPWTISLLLLGVPALSMELSASYREVGVLASVAAYVLGIAAVAGLVQGALRRRGLATAGREVAGPSLSYAAFVFAVAAATTLGSTSLDQTILQAADELQPPLNEADPLVLLISMDTVRADHLSVYGYERDTTPNLARLAADSMLFSHAMAAGDMTLSSHAAMFTGLFTSQHGAHYLPEFPAGRPLDERFVTLAEVLAERGYDTAGVVANYGFLSDAFRLNQGFRHYDNRAPVHFLGGGRPYLIAQVIRNFLKLFASPWDYDLRTRRAEQINESAIALLETAANGGRPTFLFINYMDAHWPYIPPPPFDTRYPGKDPSFTLKRYFGLLEEVSKLERELMPAEREHLLSQYDGGIAYIDAQIGELMNTLKSLGLYDDALVIVTADHGEAFGERHLMEHGVSVYGNQVHVPLIVKLPGASRIGVVDDPVSGADLMPTVLDVLGQAPPEGIQGRSLLQDEATEQRLIVSESFPRPTLIRWHPRFDRVQRAVYSGRYKLVVGTDGTREMYDLLTDPDELTDTLLANAELAARMEETLALYVETVSDGFDVGDVDQATLERLKALGYIR